VQFETIETAHAAFLLQPDLEFKCNACGKIHSLEVAPCTWMARRGLVNTILVMSGLSNCDEEVRRLFRSYVFSHINVDPMWLAVRNVDKTRLAIISLSDEAALELKIDKVKYK
jgi:hypothetical protein